jgi:hypothetical protein
MGENYTQLVDSQVNLADAAEEGARMLRWLQVRGIVGPARREGDLYLEDYGPDLSPAGKSLAEIDTIVYRPGPNYRQAAMYDGPAHLHHNWLEIITERTVFHAGDGGLGVFCIQCSHEQPVHGVLDEAIMTWWKGDPETLVCENCGHAAPLSGYKFDPVFGFGNLGFSFHNWHLYPEFIEAFQKELGRPLTVVIVHP